MGSCLQGGGGGSRLLHSHTVPCQAKPTEPDRPIDLLSGFRRPSARPGGWEKWGRFVCTTCAVFVSLTLCCVWCVVCGETGHTFPINFDWRANMAASQNQGRPGCRCAAFLEDQLFSVFPRLILTTCNERMSLDGGRVCVFWMVPFSRGCFVGNQRDANHLLGSILLILRQALLDLMRQVESGLPLVRCLPKLSQSKETWPQSHPFLGG